MSSTHNPTGAERWSDDRQTLSQAAEREGQSARNEASQASASLRDEASSLMSEARSKAYGTAESGKAAAASSLEDFSAAIRKASDELGERDQSMAANLVRQVAGGLEQASGALKGRDLQDVTRSVADFARRQPAAFLIGATLAGVALGRFARASGDHADADRVRSALPTAESEHSHTGSGESAARYASHGASSGHDTTATRTSGSAGHVPGASAVTRPPAGAMGASTPGSLASGMPTSEAIASSGSSTLAADPLGPGAPDADLLSGGAKSGSSGRTESRADLGAPGTSGSTNTQSLTGSSSSLQGDKR
ncbi:hypothetical protein [Aureimonas ureilytica]|uniref:hypothetical protein n=1 Tax=Aureimonas ureilytica TaxID=401562 RepID=UPI00073414E7|nr:hypothetical protein [Aureimonas ureilytica]